MSKTKSFLFTAALALATAFILSCSSDNGGGGGDIQSGGSSSSTGVAASSSSDGGLGIGSSSSTSVGVSSSSDGGLGVSSSSSTGVGISSSSDAGLGASSSSSDGGSSSSENAAASSSSEAPHSHVWGEWETATPATCAAEGMETRVCADDPSHTETRSVAQLAWGGWATTTPATCEAEGEQTRTCPNGATQTQAIAQLNWGNWATTTPATCEAEGEQTRTCPGNASPAETRSIALLAWGNWATTTPATCEAEGEQTRTCPGNASPAETRSVAQLDWSEWAIATPATCEAAGVERRTCPGNASPAETRSIIPKLDWGEWETVSATPICTTAGVAIAETRACPGNASPAETRYITTASPLPARRHYEKDKEQFCDARDGKAYVYVEIGTQTWMAENLNYNAANSRCYNNSESNCAIYGRLYNWATAMDLPSSCNSSRCSSQIGSKHRGICPQGWHIPSDAELTVLYTYVGTNPGTKLKAASGWNSHNLVPAGTDDFGFSALPGGYGSSSVGDRGLWWSSELYADYAYVLGMIYNSATVYKYEYDKTSYYSVRCVRD